MNEMLGELLHNCARRLGSACLPATSGACLVRVGRRCAVFEQNILLPMQTRPEYAGAAAEYRRHLSPATSAAGPRDEVGECADCGQPRPKRKRYCARCALRHKKASWRAASARRRKARSLTS